MAFRLPATISACRADLDGVLTETAALHAEAWKRAFDELPARRAASSGEAFVAFDAVADYDACVDGRPRLDGAGAFLSAGEFGCPREHPRTRPGGTVHGLAGHKNELVFVMMKERGVAGFPGSLRLLEEVRRRKLATAVASSRANTIAVLRAVGIEDRFDGRAGGVVAAEEHLAGKPAPDVYLAAARRLGITPSHATVFEDALAGVEAGKRGVVGVDRVKQPAALVAHGADLAVADLAELVGP